MTTRPVPAPPTWNVLVTSLEGHRESLLRALRTLVRFRRGGFPNVLVATLDDRAAFLAALRELQDASPSVREGLGRVIPIDRTMRFAEPSTFSDDVTAALEPLLDRLVGKTFFVRLYRRGFRGGIDSTRTEGEIGARLVAALQARGDAPKVRFKGADVAIAIETLRDEAGVALLDRSVRETYPFVRVR